MPCTLVYNNTMKKRNRKPKFETPEDALLHHLTVGDPDECWEWHSARTPMGYGLFTHRAKNYYAHRVAYETFVGPIPDGLDVCHTCDNPSCCNPAHLWVGSAKDNAQDMVKKGRDCHAVFRGEDHANSKLTASQVREIRRLCEEGINQTEIGKRFSVSQSAVMAIRTGRTWKHLE